MLKKVGIDISLTKVERMKDCLIGFFLLIEGRFLTFRKDNFHNGSYIENIVLKISLIFKILC